MKKFLLTLSFLVTLCCYTFAQGVVTMSGTVTDANGATLSNYPLWVVSDSSSGVVFFQTVYTNNNGIYSVNATVGAVTQGAFYVTIQDSCTGAYSTQTVYFNPGNMVINNIDFTVCSVTPSPCQAGMWYQQGIMGYAFTGIATGGTPPYTYSWNFGNGMTSTLQNPTMAYNAPGTYYPCVTITDATGCVATYCDSLGIVVGGGGSNCAASFTYQLSNNTASFISSATGTTGAVSYFWSFGDGNSSMLANPTHTYTTSGVYFPTLTITDGSGCTATYVDTNGVVINTGGGGGNCGVTFISQTTPVGSVSFTSTVTNVSNPVAYVWDFGDGTTSTQSNPVHTYNSTGLYLACLTITDSVGCSATYCDTVQVGSGGANCSATITYSMSAMGVSASVAVTGTGPYTYSWSFGNGTGSSVANPTIVYANPGTYVICVTVTDATGCVATDCITVTITSQTSGDLNVLVISDSTTFAQAVVYLIQHDTVAGTLTAIQTDTALQGYVTFSNLPFGDYLLKAALIPSDPNFANYLPTYFQQSLTWSGATSVNLSPNTVGFALIELIQGNNVGGGPGFIGGLISQGANRGPGDPFVGALVILYDANMNPITYTYTDDDGEYSFDNLPYGVYYVYVEELGIAATPIQVTLSPTTPSMDQVHFDINSTRVTFTSINNIQAVTNLKVFPNPVTDELYMQMDLDQMIDADISIVNMTGQILQQRQTTLTSGNHFLNFNTQELPAGVYTLQLRSNLGVITHKFVKQSR